MPPDVQVSGQPYTNDRMRCTGSLSPRPGWCTPGTGVSLWGARLRVRIGRKPPVREPMVAQVRANGKSGRANRPSESRVKCGGCARIGLSLSNTPSLQGEGGDEDGLYQEINDAIFLKTNRALLTFNFPRPVINRLILSQFAVDFPSFIK